MLDTFKTLLVCTSEKNHTGPPVPSPSYEHYTGGTCVTTPFLPCALARLDSTHILYIDLITLSS